MRFFILMAIYGIVSIVLTTTLFAHLPAQMLRFDFIICAVAAISFYQERRHAVPVLILYGMLMDVASSAPFGMSILSYLIVYVFVRAIISKISFQEGVAQLFWIAIISLVDKSICALVMLVSTGDFKISSIIIERAPAQALLDAAIGLFMVPMLQWYWDLSWEKLRQPKGLELRAK